jgi:hypothetical protein
MTRSEKLLRLMKKRGGMRYNEIVKQFVEWAGHDWNEKQLSPSVFDNASRWSKAELSEMTERYGKPKSVRRWRGFWSDNLLGGFEPHHRQGLLKRFCRKGKDGKWRVVKTIKPPFVPMSR